MYCSKGIWLMILGTLLLAGAQAISMNYAAGGDGSAIVSGGLNLKALTSDSIDSSTTLAFVSSPGLRQATSGSGSIQETHTAKSPSTNATTEVGVNVVRSRSYSYSYHIYPKQDDVDNGYAHADESLTVSKADDIFAYAEASNPEGYIAYTDVYASSASQSASISGYRNTADADDASASVTQRATSVSGDCYFHQEATNYGALDEWYYALNMSDVHPDYSRAFSTMTLYPGSVSGSSIQGYSDSASASGYGETITRNVNSASGSFISFDPCAESVTTFSVNGNYYYGAYSTSITGTSINKGTIAKFIDGSSGYSEKVTSGDGIARTYVKLKVKGPDTDIMSYADNIKPAWERFMDENGDEVPTFRGTGSFEVKAKNSKAYYGYSLTSTSKPDGITIAPKLPTGTKTAMVLEPFRTYAEDGLGGRKLGDTVVPALVNKGYAVLRYTDSAVTKEKVKALDDYNVALVISHMNPSIIELSTRASGSERNDRVNASDLKSWYISPPKSSLIVLAGCEPFGGKMKPSPLASAVSKASIRGGFTGSVLIVYAQDYMARLFTNMAKGMTAGDANLATYNQLKTTYGVNPNISKLWLYGNTSFNL